MVVVRELEVKYKSKESLSLDAAILDSPEKAFNFLRDKIGDEIKENFVALSLNGKNKILGWEVVSIGTVSESIVHPREVFRTAIMINASALIIAHNHPTGAALPSREDILTTERLVESGKIIGIPILDHIVVGCDNFYSFKSEGRI